MGDPKKPEPDSIGCTVFLVAAVAWAVLAVQHLKVRIWWEW